MQNDERRVQNQDWKTEIFQERPRRCRASTQRGAAGLPKLSPSWLARGNADNPAMKHIYPITFGVMLALSVCFLAIGVHPTSRAHTGNGHMISEK
jgi:hypothetical protein